jgi:hypothetical protein
MLTKKDFKLFADELAKKNATPSEVERMKDILRKTNPRFDDTKFDSYVEKRKKFFMGTEKFV